MNTSAARYANDLDALLCLVSDLKLDPNNVRAHSDRNLQAIVDSLRQFGQQKPIVVAADGTVLAGNGTLAAVKKLGWTEIAAVTTSLEGAAARGYAIADNRTAELAEWDVARLAEELGDLDPVVVAAAGFDEAEIGRVLRDAEAAIRALDTGADDDVVPESPQEATTIPGDMWLLGDHRLLCGDSGEAADVDHLLGGERVQLVHTDPPYGVAVQPRSNSAMRAGLSSFSSATNAPASGRLRPKDRPLANDEASDDYPRLLRAWFANISRVLDPGRAFYIWGGYANCGNYPTALEANDLYFSQSLIWVKGHPVINRKDYMGDHEWCFYGWRKGAAHEFYGPNNVTDVWQVQKLHHSKTVHLTEKPVELAVRAIEYSSTPGENVLDLFGGSGSTLVACERTSRRAFLMELDPLYCDVIVARWEQLTGKKAERA